MNPNPVPVLIEAALRAFLAAVAVWGGMRLLRVSNVLVQKAAWMLVLAAGLAMPLAMRWQWLPANAQVRVPASAWRQAEDSAPMVRTSPDQADTVAQMQAATAGTETVPASADRFPAPVISSNQVNPPVQSGMEAGRTARLADAAPQPKPASIRPALLAWIVYLAICGALLLRLIHGLGRAWGLWWTATPILSGMAAAIPAGLSLRSSAAIFSPVTIGSGVVLPADCAGWDAEKLRIVLAHERSHIRQGDFYLQLAAGLYAALFWFSPLGWWLKRKLSELGEAIGDRAGLEEADSRASYAQVLLEFAALPRPTLLGVAMARTSNLSDRIERLLNETNFRQAFAGSRGRALAVILLVPLALFGATALVRVEAAGTQASSPAAIQLSTTAPATQITGQSHPEQAPDQAEPQSPAPPPAPPQSQVNPASPPPPAEPGSTVVPEGEGAAPMPPPPPAPLEPGEVRARVNPQVTVTTNTQDNTAAKTYTYNIGYALKNGSYTFNQSNQLSNRLMGRGYALSYSSNGDSWALITDGSQRVTFPGDWNDGVRATIDKVRKLTRGKFLWFSHDGKSYFIDDPAIVAGIEAMYLPMEALGKQQEELGKKQEELGKQQEALGKLMEQARIPAPDISKEMADLTAAMAKLQSKLGKTVSQEELGVLEGKLAELEGRLGAISGELGAKQGDIGGKMGTLGAMQGELGSEQGKLGAEQGRIAAEADRKVKAIVEESLRNGKAKPVE